MLTGCAADAQKVPVHFGEGERLFYGQVQDAAVPIRQALAEHLEADSSQAAQPAHDDAPPSPSEQDSPSLHARRFTLGTSKPSWYQFTYVHSLIESHEEQ